MKWKGLLKKWTSSTHWANPQCSRPHRAWHPSACHKVEAVCCAQVVQASGKQSRQALADREKNKMMVWQWCKQRMKIFLWSFALHHSHDWNIGFYFSHLPLVPVTLVASRTFSIPSFLSHYKLTSQLVLARSMAALFFCGGNKVAATAPLFVRALYRAWLPRTSHTPVAGALATSQRYALWKVDRSSKWAE